MKVKKNEPMRNHTTWRIGGPVDLLVQPESVEELQQALQQVRASGQPYYVIGGGSNLLVADEGLPGTVIQLGGCLCGLQINGTRVIAEAGVPLPLLARKAAEQNLSGLEFAAGIPGTVGGAVVMNAGAYGGEMKDVLTEVTVMDEEGAIVTLPADKLELGYRTSIIKTAGYIVLEAKLQLKEGNPEVIRETMKDLTIRRTTKQPLEYPSAGSTFKRPEGYFAGKLIMDSGLAGYQVGGAQVSEKHCGFVINAGGATARDVRTLMDNVRDIVYKKYGVTLEPEVKFLGDFEA